MTSLLNDRARRPLTALQRFVRTPKGLLTFVLGVMVVLAAPADGVRQVLPGLAAAAVVAMLIDAPILRYRSGAWEFPSGALLSGLIVAMVLSPQEPWHVVAVTSAIAVASKYAFRTRSANVFNPAAFALAATFRGFDTGLSWWGALPNLPYGVIVLLVTGFYMADRVNRMPMVLAFLGGYFLLFTTAAFLGDPRRVVEIFRAPDLQAVLFFAFFILTDPPTSPAKYPDQLVYGGIVAAACFAVFEWNGGAYYLLAGVLAGNPWEAWRRVRARKPAPRATRSAPISSNS